jgi:hypothetical protein
MKKSLTIVLIFLITVTSIQCSNPALAGKRKNRHQFRRKRARPRRLGRHSAYARLAGRGRLAGQRCSLHIQRPHLGKQPVPFQLLQLA